jgi:hypothetical protein
MSKSVNEKLKSIMGHQRNAVGSVARRSRQSVPTRRSALRPMEKPES